MLNYLGVRCHDVSNLLSTASGKTKWKTETNISQGRIKQIWQVLTITESNEGHMDTHNNISVFL